MPVFATGASAPQFGTSFTAVSPGIRTSRPATRLSLLLLVGLLAPGLVWAQQMPDSEAEQSQAPAQQPEPTLIQADDAVREDALLLWRQGDFNGAVRVTLAEIQEDPRNRDSYTVLGWALLDLGRYADAVRYGRQGLSLFSDVRVIRNVGEAYFRLGNYSEALAYLERSVAINPRSPGLDEVYVLLGAIHRQFGELLRAEFAYLASLHINSQYVPAWLGLGSIREQLGETEGAREAYEQALVIRPNIPEARDALLRLSAEG